MEKIDKFLQFFIENLDDKRISVYKKMKYGHRYYYIIFLVDDDPNQNTKNSIYQYRDNMEIVFDNRNLCIEVYGGDENNTLIIEDKNLLEKWSNILEEITSKNLEEKVINIFEKTLNECYNKNLYRELQMKKLFKEDERL